MTTKVKKEIIKAYGVFLDGHLAHYKGGTEVCFWRKKVYAEAFRRGNKEYKIVELEIKIKS